MAKSKLQKLGKEEVARRVRVKQRTRRNRNIKRRLNSFSLILNSALLLYITHLHGELLPFLTNIYRTILNTVAPIMESLLQLLPL